MGELIQLAERREARRTRTQRRPAIVRADFMFDLACPFTYLVAERVERAFDDVRWMPASTTALRAGSLGSDAAATEAVRVAAEQRAAALRMPLVWPETFPVDVPAAMRVAAHAAECGRGAAFVLAAGRLAFCGGFDLDDPEILFEAAAAAGLALDDCLRAAGDRSRDVAIEAAGRRLLSAGADRLPALRIDRSLFWGEGQVSEAAATARHDAAAAYPS
jgi:2-hydroxychromene-2-carboxylate isomerase